jgi:predicted Fe-Mo cluster-binding NifX family protein
MTRIAVASDDGDQIAAHTGRCRQFIVYDIEGPVARRIEVRPNRVTAHARGECTVTGGGATAPTADLPAPRPGPSTGHHPGHSHHSHEGLLEVLADCQVLLTRGLGARLVDDLARRGIEAFICRDDRADAAAALFAQGLLSRASRPACGHAS